MPGPQASGQQRSNLAAFRFYWRSKLSGRRRRQRSASPGREFASFVNGGITTWEISTPGVATFDLPYEIVTINLGPGTSDVGDQDYGPDYTAFTLDPGKWTSVPGAVPEPSTWAMMLLGFAGLCFAGFRARARAVAAD